MLRCEFTRVSAAAGLALLAAWPAQAALTLDFSYIDTQSHAFERFENWATPALPPTNQRPYAFSATDAVYLWVATSDPRWATLAATMVEEQVAAAEAAWSANPPVRPAIAGDSYLESGPMLRDLGMVWAFCPTFVTPAQRTRWSAYAERAVANIWDPDNASWGGHPFPWTGWSIDNPGNNYYYSFLQASMFWGFAKPAGGTDWIAFLNSQKIPPLVDYFEQLGGGGSREGTGYGLSHGRLFELYDVWRQSTAGHINIADDSSHLVDSIDYWIHATLPTLDRYAPIGDLSRESYPNLYDYHRALVLKARRTAASVPGSSAAMNRATWWLNHIAVDEMMSGFNLRDDLLPEGAVETAPAALTHHATGVGHFFARTSWQEDATWMSLVAGPYEESHAHQDQGAFTLFRGDFLAVTENVFSHSGIQQGPEVHNVLRFEQAGEIIPQRHGSTTLQVGQQAGKVILDTDLTPFYAHAGSIDNVDRHLEFSAEALVVRDLYQVDPGVEAIFQVNVPVQPTIGGHTVIAGNLRIVPLVPAQPTINIVDWSSVDPDEFPNGGWRIELRGGNGEYHVRLETGGSLFSDGFESGNTAAWH